MAELDIRLGVMGLRIDNKNKMIEDINKSIDEYKELLEVPCDSDEAYKLYKDVRKQIKDERNLIYNTVKDRVKEFTANIEEDKKMLYGMYDEIYNEIDKRINAFETEYNCGAVKAAATRKSNKAAAKAEDASLTLILRCPSAEAKARIVQFAQELGATIEG